MRYQDQTHNINITSHPLVRLIIRVLCSEVRPRQSSSIWLSGLSQNEPAMCATESLTKRHFITCFPKWLSKNTRIASTRRKVCAVPERCRKPVFNLRTLRSQMKQCVSGLWLPTPQQWDYSSTLHQTTHAIFAPERIKLTLHSTHTLLCRFNVSHIVLMRSAQTIMLCWRDCGVGH